MEHRNGIPTVRAGSGTEVDRAVDRTASDVTSIDVTAAPRPRRVARPAIETRQLMVQGVAFVYQRFHEPLPEGPPAALLQHFPTETGAWDPTAPPRTSSERELVLIEQLDRAAGADTDTQDVGRLAHESVEFIDALGLAEVDLLGFSLGFRPAEDVVLLSPRLVQRLVTSSQLAR